MVDVNKVVEEAKKIQKEYHYFTTICETPVTGGEGELSGAALSVKDALCVKGIESRAASAILNGYHPVYQSTVAQRIIDAGGVIVGKSTQDVFGFGSFNVNVGNGFSIPLNPFDKKRVTGGSSGGACGIVQVSGYQTMGVAESTGGSIVAPASFCGVYGLCPTYGRVSRYGLMDYGSSLDKLGPVGKTVSDVRRLLSVMGGRDEKDSTSVECPNVDAVPVSKMRVGIVTQGFGEGVNTEVSESVRRAIDGMSGDVSCVEEVSVPFVTKYSVPAYYLLAMCEASTNLSMHCGMRYGAAEKLEGTYNDYFSHVRSTHFTTEAKRRILLGTFARMSGFRDAYYIKAAKVRTKVIEEYQKVFSKYDILVTPTMPILPPLFEDVKKLSALEHYMMDILTVGPNLAGLPHLNVPVGFSKKSKLPIGMLLTSNHFREDVLLDLASTFNNGTNVCSMDPSTQGIKGGAST